MIRNPRILKWMMFISPSIVLHVGAHHGQDRQSYKKLGVEKIIWGEASKENAVKLKSLYPEDVVVERIFWEKSDLHINFFNTSSSENSSAIKPNNLESVDITSCRTITVDEVMSREISKAKILIVLDVQGAEMHVLKGSIDTLKKAKYVVIEIALKSQGYEETPSEDDIDTFMKNHKFTKSIERSSHDGSYKDQLYIRNKNQRIIINAADLVTRIARKYIHLVRFSHTPTSPQNCDICNVVR